MPERTPRPVGSSLANNRCLGHSRLKKNALADAENAITRRAEPLNCIRIAITTGPAANIGAHKIKQHPNSADVANMTSEERRLSALHHLDILKTRERAFDDIASLAAMLFRAPIALVSLVEHDFQWFKACIGLEVDSTTREVSFCAHAIAQDDLDKVFVIPDAMKDPRFKDNVLVTGPPHIRMYVGAPLVTQSGQAIGSLCVIDRVPREPSAEQIEALRLLARSVVA